MKIQIKEIVLSDQSSVYNVILFGYEDPQRIEFSTYCKKDALALVIALINTVEEFATDNVDLLDNIKVVQ